MRKAFEVQLELGQTAIEKVRFAKSRHELPAILAGLQWMFMTKAIRDEVLELLAREVLGGKKATGRNGMDLWHILVLGVVRLGLDCDYDHLADLANYHAQIRQILGVEALLGADAKGFHRKTLSQNVAMLDEDMLEKINVVVARQGHALFQKKGRSEPLEIKVDSYVLETNVHFPTDLNLLWDAHRKSIQWASELCSKHGIPGWRKSANWESRLKALMREASQACKAGGARKVERVVEKAQQYVDASLRIEAKIFESWFRLRECPLDEFGMMQLSSLAYFHDEMIRHVDLVQRRLIEGESIPHDEKIFSLFEPHSEWINKGKTFPPVEIGHKVQIATSRHGLILDCAILENQSEMDALIPCADRLLSRYGPICSLSTDKGYSRAEDKQLLELYIANVVIPKRGRLNQQQREVEGHQTFRALRHRHSAVESDINCLEHHGLNRCPDKGRRGFGRYVGLGVLAYNLHKIGSRILQSKQAPPAAQAA